MTFQAYLDNIKAKTGKTPEDFRVLAAKKGLAKSCDIVARLKAEFGLGRARSTNARNTRRLRCYVGCKRITGSMQSVHMRCSVNVCNTTSATSATLRIR
jgi:hypothetical protein